MSRGPRARAIQVPLLERPRLAELAARQQLAHVVVLRAKMILLLGQGHGPTEVARRLGCSDRNVRKWRAKWEARPCVESLYDGDREGRPARILAETRCAVISVACADPADLLVPFRTTWTQEQIAKTVRLRFDTDLSRSSVQRILLSEGLRPHRVRQWLHSPDPDFKEKVARVCDLYRNPPSDAVVLCVDEKPLQATERVHPVGRGRNAEVRREFEYRRQGVAHLLAALDIRTGEVIADVVPSRSADALLAFMKKLACRFRRKRVIVIWDNLNIHHEGRDNRWSRFNEDHGSRFEFVHTPKHASWVNQIELWFSILQRRVIRHGSFDSIARLQHAVEAFARYWNLYEKKPFRWTFTGRFHDTRAAA